MMPTSYEQLQAMFEKDRREALCDLSKFEAFTAKYGIELPKCPETRLRMILKARTACKDLPIALRREAKAQLQAMGSHSLDDGDLG